MASLADNLEPPYYAAIIKNDDSSANDETISPADKLVTLAVRRPGFLGLETARGNDGKPLTVAYWRDMSDVEGWTSESNANPQGECPVQVRRINSAAEVNPSDLYVVNDEGSATWRYT
jgi:hypothetical protein